MTLLFLLLSMLATISAQPEPAPQDSAFQAALSELHTKAQQGDTKALLDLANLYDRGYQSIVADPQLATELYIKAAEKGDSHAQNFAGFRLISGIGTQKDIAKGISWIEKAALQGEPRACNNLGSLLMQGEIVEQDFSKAAYWLSKAADAGLPTAQASLADLYKNGQGLLSDTIQAARLYDAAIAAGLTDAGLKLQAMMYPRWKNLSAEEAVQKGRKYYAGAAPFIGVTLFEIALENNPSSADAAALLADAYSKALGVEYDYNKSLQLYFKAARLGNPSAQFVIGELLQLFPDALTDFSPSSDEQNPFYWLENAAQKGISNAEAASKALLTPPNIH